MALENLRQAVQTRWKHIRGAFILFHVVAALAMGFPAPEGVMSRDAWREPSVQNEMAIWTSRINAVGIQVDSETFQDFLWDFSKAFLDVRKVVLRPFQPYADWTGARQSWRMFSAPHRWPVRLQVDVRDRETKNWTTVFISRSDEFTWNRRKLDHHRLRRLVFLHAWKRYEKRYFGFCDWLGREAVGDFPDADRLRCRQYKYRTPEPSELLEGHREIEGKFQARREVDLDKLRAKLEAAAPPAMPSGVAP